MRSRWMQKALAGAAFMSLLGGYALAQAGAAEEGKRKAKTKVLPVYPDLAKRMAASSIAALSEGTRCWCSHALMLSGNGDL